MYDISPYPSSSIPRNSSLAFRQEALRHLENGLSLRRVSILMGVTTGTLTRWKKQAETTVPLLVSEKPGDSPPTDRRQNYSGIFKERDLTQNAKEQFVTLVTHAIEMPSIAKDNIVKNIAGKIKPAHKEIYEQAFKDRALFKIKKGISINRISKMMGIAKGTLYHWKRRLLPKGLHQNLKAASEKR